MDVSLKKGAGSETFRLDEAKQISVLKGADIPALSLDAAAGIIQEGVKKDAPADIRKAKVALVVPDDTRLWARGDILVPAILDALTALGVPDAAITLLIALGTHADIPPKRWDALVGKGTADRFRILNSANQDRQRLDLLGRTRQGTEVSITREACDADHVIVFGGVLHHLIAGFGGGRKYILPGIAGYDAIQQNHALAFLPDGSAHPEVRQAVLAGNPVHEDMVEAARMFLKGRTATFATVAVNGEGDIFHAAAGPMEKTFEKGCEEVDRACSVAIDKPGDFALISAGGLRTDAQLYQSTKALFNAVNAVRDGGKILFVAQARDGAGHPMFEQMLKQYRGHPERVGALLRDNFNMAAYVAFRVMDLLKRYEVSLVSDFSREETLELGFEAVGDLQAWSDALTGRGYIIPYAENILPILKETGSDMKNGSE